ncbi:selenocysteine lyase-like [Liolophura sinensis]|uniref:selenocysteine lyase-like n=1 Tax=Liolophura sinensis TaxID=3198878 RepID=UPI0031596B02
MSKDRVYLDYNATTPLDPQVIEAVTEALEGAWGNPSSSHGAGQKAKHMIDKARKHLADMVGALTSDIIFTSGGTEANNLVLHSALKYFHQESDKADGRIGLPHFITSNLEHDSIKLVLQHFEEEKLAEVTNVPASKKTGRVEIDDVISAIRPSTCLITVMTANNETGVIQPISEISERVRCLGRQKGDFPRILLHTDAAQAIGKIPVDIKTLGVDYLTIVGHKFYGPRIGALCVRKPGKATPLYPSLFGGGQERSFRPGTENTPMIAGLGKAAELVVQDLERYEKHMREIREYLERKLKEEFGEGVTFNGRFEKSCRIPNTCNVSFLGRGLEGHRILSKCTRLQASIGAACHAQNRPSPILLAIGIPESVARNALRLSVGRETSRDDINVIVTDLKEVIQSLRSD